MNFWKNPRDKILNTFVSADFFMGVSESTGGGQAQVLRKILGANSLRLLKRQFVCNETVSCTASTVERMCPSGRYSGASLIRGAKDLFY